MIAVCLFDRALIKLDHSMSEFECRKSKNKVGTEVSSWIAFFTHHALLSDFWKRIGCLSLLLTSLAEDAQIELCLLEKLTQPYGLL